MSDAICTMVSRHEEPKPKVPEKIELGLRELSFEKAILGGREVLWPIDKETGARLAGVRACSVVSGLEQETVMTLEIVLGGEDVG